MRQCIIISCKINPSDRIPATGILEYEIRETEKDRYLQVRSSFTLDTNSFVLVTEKNVKELFQDAVFTSGLVKDEGKKEKNTVSDRFSEEYQYEYFKLLMSKLGKIRKENTSVLGREQVEFLKMLRGGKQQDEKVPIEIVILVILKASHLHAVRFSDHHLTTTVQRHYKMPKKACCDNQQRAFSCFGSRCAEPTNFTFQRQSIPPCRSSPTPGAGGSNPFRRTKSL